VPKGTPIVMCQIRHPSLRLVHAYYRVDRAMLPLLGLLLLDPLPGSRLLLATLRTDEG
jgi:hypothetical protein